MAAFNLIANGSESIKVSTPFDVLRYNGFFGNLVINQQNVTNLILGDPLFAKPAGGNYHLRADSPYRDVASFADLTNVVAQMTGSNEVLPRLVGAYAGGQDYYGNPRSVNALLDVGAAEALSGTPSGVQITVTQPVAGTVTNAGSRLPAAVTIAPAEVEIVSVDYFYDGIRVLSTNNAPFAGVWTSDSVGELPFEAHGVLSDGLIITSAPVAITRVVPPNNRPPQVNVNLPKSPFRAYQRPRFSFFANDPEGRLLSLVELKFDGTTFFTTNSVPSGFGINTSLPTLTPGEHQLDASARDNYGVATNKSYTLTVEEARYLPLATTAHAPADLAASVFETLNETGAAAGAGRTDLLSPVPIFWRDGLLSQPGTNAGTIHSLNAAGVGAGEVRLEDGSTQPARFAGGEVQILSTNAGLARFINDRGTILGHFSPTNAARFFLWRTNGLQEVTNDPPSTLAVIGLTDDDRVLVQLMADGQPTVPAWWQNGTLTPLFEFTDTRFVALGLSGNGLVTGYASPVISVELSAALWRDSQLHLLGSPTNQATWGRAVNRDGLVLGVLDLPPSGAVPALFEGTNTVRLDLVIADDVGGSSIPSLVALNGSGWLAGQANDRALLLVPTQQAIAPTCHLREGAPGTWEVEVKSIYSPVTLTLESSSDLAAWEVIFSQRSRGFIHTLPAGGAQVRFLRASLQP